MTKELFTRSYDKEWGRIVNIFVDRCEGVSVYINDDSTYKILALDEGTLIIRYKDREKLLVAPAVVLLTEKEVLFEVGEKKIHTTTVYLKPTEIRDEFTLDRLASGEFEYERGKSIFQDYLLVRPFERDEYENNTIVLPGIAAYDRIIKIIGLMEGELVGQKDGYWPCRSRSYLIELLSFIGYVCARPLPDSMLNSAVDTQVVSDLCVVYSGANESNADKELGRIVQYLSMHIGDKVKLEDLMREFSMNRNQINELFVRNTSMTWLAYFTRMKINLAQIMLAETELQVAEIGNRVGYDDANYFVKVFKKATGVSPTKYRDVFMK